VFAKKAAGVPAAAPETDQPVRGDDKSKQPAAKPNLPVERKQAPPPTKVVTPAQLPVLDSSAKVELPEAFASLLPTDPATRKTWIANFNTWQGDPYRIIGRVRNGATGNGEALYTEVKVPFANAKRGAGDWNELVRGFTLLAKYLPDGDLMELLKFFQGPKPAMETIQS
jgi:hypothetical protein